MSLQRLASLTVVSDAPSWLWHPESTAGSQHAHATASAMVVHATRSLGAYGKDGSSGEMQAHLRDQLETTIKYGAGFKEAPPYTTARDVSKEIGLYALTLSTPHMVTAGAGASFMQRQVLTLTLTLTLTSSL